MEKSRTYSGGNPNPNSSDLVCHQLSPGVAFEQALFDSCVSQFTTQEIMEACEGYRWEHDLLGDEQVPVDAYYGIQTMRAIENFDVSAVFPIRILSGHFIQMTL